MKISFDELLAKTHIDFRSVMKFYFQWITLAFLHGLLFFYLPISGNLKTHAKTYCDPRGSLASGKPTACNDFKDNWYIISFYILSCFYFWLSAL